MFIIFFRIHHVAAWCVRTLKKKNRRTIKYLPRSLFLKKIDCQWYLLKLRHFNQYSESVHSEKPNNDHVITKFSQFQNLQSLMISLPMVWKFSQWTMRDWTSIYQVVDFSKLCHLSIFFSDNAILLLNVWKTYALKILRKSPSTCHAVSYSKCDSSILCRLRYILAQILRIMHSETGENEQTFKELSHDQKFDKSIILFRLRILLFDV